MASKIDI